MRFFKLTFWLIAFVAFFWATFASAQDATILASIPTDREMKSTALLPGSNVAYGIVSQGNSLYIFNLGDYSVKKTPLNGQTRSLAINPVDGKVLVTAAGNSTSGYLYVISPDNTIAKTITINGDLQGVAINPVNNSAVIALEKDQKLLVLSTETYVVSKQISLAYRPQTVAIDSATNTAVVIAAKPNGQGVQNILLLLDLNRGTVLFSKTIKYSITSVDIASDKGLAVAVSTGGVHIIDIKSGNIISEISETNAFGVGINHATEIAVIAKTSSIDLLDLNLNALTEYQVNGPVDPVAVSVDRYKNICLISGEDVLGKSETVVIQLPNPLPEITSLVPLSATAGDSGFTLEVAGDNFVTSSLVQFNQNGLTTNFVDNNTLLTSIPASLITVPGLVSVTVTNPLPEGGTSNPFSFEIKYPIHTLKTLIVNPEASSISAGESQTYAVTGLDIYGNSMDVSGTIFSIVPEGLCTGTICYAAIAGLHTVTALNSGIFASASLTVHAGALNTLLISPETSAIVAGESQGYTITGLDAFGNSVDVSSSTLSINPDGACTDGACTATTAGLHAVTALNSGITAVANLTVNAGAPATLKISPATATISAGESQAYITEAFDVYGNSLGDVTSKTSFSISPDGSCAGSICTSISSGAHAVTANYNNVVATADLIVNPGPAVAFSITVPAIEIAGTAFDIQVSARDSYNNIASAYKGAIQFASSDDQAVVPGIYTFLDTAQGVHKFPSGTILKTAGTQTISAIDITDPMITGISGSIAVNPANAVKFTVTASAVATAGAAFDLTVTAKDAFENVVTNYLGTIQLTSGDGQAMLPANYTFTDADSGSHVFIAETVLRTAGTQTISATDSVDPAITATSGSIAVSAGDLDHITITPESATIIAGGTQSYVARAFDAYGNSLDASGTTFSISPDGSCSESDCTAKAGGIHTVTANKDDKTATATLTVTIATLSSISPDTLSAGSADFTLKATGSNFMPGYVINFNGQDLITAYNNSNELTGTVPAVLIASEGISSVTVMNTYSVSSNSLSFTVTKAIPPDPVTVAPSLDPSVTTTMSASTQFLYTGDNPIQTGMAPGTIDLKLAAVIKGRVLKTDGGALSGVTISILNHPEFGSTVSRTDGAFDMAVNGGGTLIVRYDKAGYLPIQRQANVPWQDYALVPDVVMIQLDSHVSSIDLSSSSSFQVARGSVVTDNDGTRQATLLFRQGTTANMIFSDGSVQPLTTMNVHITEYTVGEKGPSAMPADMPSNIAYTYAVEFSADEAITAGAKEIQFSQPVISYNENFLNFETGTIVPVGSYDRDQGAWIPSDNGLVIKILGISNGMATIDVYGNDLPASAEDLAILGITDAELARLAILYQPGQSLWRVPIPHFTQPWDFNWGWVPPWDAVAANQPAPKINPPLDCSSTSTGSIIECENQTLGETEKITGTSMSLNYRSSRVPGRKAAYTMRIPLSGATIPASLKKIVLDISVAGRSFHIVTSPGINKSYLFAWDGRDAYGRQTQGAQPVTTNIGYVYEGVYVVYKVSQYVAGSPGMQLNTAMYDRVFGHFSFFGIYTTADRARNEITLWQTNYSTIKVGSWNAQSQGLGGWTLNVQHAYDPVGQVLYYGDGQQRDARNSNIRVISSIVGNGTASYSGDGSLAAHAGLNAPSGTAVDSAGNLYIADTLNHRIRKVDTNGIITTIAGNGSSGYSGDSGSALQAMLNNPSGVAIDNFGNIYI